MKTFLCKILVVSLLITPSLVWATRPMITFGAIVERTPLIFDARVEKYADVAAPVDELYLHTLKRALEVQFTVTKIWKGEVRPVVLAYTWPLGEAPCRGVELKQGESYLVWAEWDAKKKTILFDFCSGLQAHDLLSSPETHAQLKVLLKGGK